MFNGAFDYALIFGHFGAPRLGLMGSGIASATSFFFTFLAMLAVVRLTPKLHKYRIFVDALTPDWSKLREVYVLGLPIGFTMLFEALLFFSSNFIMGHLGTDVLAAHIVSLNIPSVTFMVPLGVAMAATVRVGLAAGANDGEAVRRAGWTAIGVAAVFMSFCAVILALWPFEIAALILPATKANLPALALAVTFLHVAAAFQLFDGVQVAAALSLRGLKDARAPMWIAGASYWLAGFPTCIVLGFGSACRGSGSGSGWRSGFWSRPCCCAGGSGTCRGTGRDRRHFCRKFHAEMPPAHYWEVHKTGVWSDSMMFGNNAMRVLGIGLQSFWRRPRRLSPTASRP